MNLLTTTERIHRLSLNFNKLSTVDKFPGAALPIGKTYASIIYEININYRLNNRQSINFLKLQIVNNLPIDHRKISMI